MRRLALAVLTLIAAQLAAVGAAQAVVVAPSAVGATVAYDGGARSAYLGVAMVPGTDATLATAGIPAVQTAGSCGDPWLSSDLRLPISGLCWHGGAVLHGNETFALTWDPTRSYWSGTRAYVEQFLRDVADASGSFTSPYAATTQYRDGAGRAANASLYGGACIDHGDPGGYTCGWGDVTGSGVGANYPASGCPISGGAAVCLADTQVRDELAGTLQRTAVLTSGRVKAGFAPLFVVLLPKNVESCADAGGKLCSVNAASPAQFCSYHGEMTVSGIEVAYVVQPWTAGTSCDEPGLSVVPDPAINAGMRIVNPLSQAHTAAIVNPFLNGWFAAGGGETYDNDGCVPHGVPADNAIVGASAQNPYFLAPEFSNAGVIDNDPYTPSCAGGVVLQPGLVAPSAVNPGDVVQFDGSATRSSLIVPKAAYAWTYGDGGTAFGPSVEHAYPKPGSYTVTLKVTDRGGNTASLSRTITVLGQNGVLPPSTGTPPATPGLLARLALLPQGLKGLLRSGVSLRVTSNQPASGLATISISRGAARRAHLRVGHGASVVIGRGTIAGVAGGTTYLRIRVGHAMASKLGRLRHLTLSVRVLLITSSRGHIAVDAAGNY